MTGGLSWYVALRRGLLAALDHVYRQKRGTERQWNRVQHQNLELTHQLTPELVGKLEYIISALRFGLVGVSNRS